MSSFMFVVVLCLGIVAMWKEAPAGALAFMAFLAVFLVSERRWER